MKVMETPKSRAMALSSGVPIPGGTLVGSLGGASHPAPAMLHSLHAILGKGMAGAAFSSVCP